MSTIAISDKDLPKELQSLEGRLREAVYKGIRSGARRGRAHLVRKTPKDQGLMKAAWKDSATRAGAATSAQVAEVFNESPYAGIVEHGARPHPVSLEGQRAIFEWVKRHMTLAGPMPSRKKAHAVERATALDANDQAFWEITQAIVRKIRAHGQKPTYFIRDSQGQLLKFVLQEVVRTLGEASTGGR